MFGYVFIKPKNTEFFTEFICNTINLLNGKIVLW